MYIMKNKEIIALNTNEETALEITQRKPECRANDTRAV
jgi:hypothetical protein